MSQFKNPLSILFVLSLFFSVEGQAQICQGLFSTFYKPLPQTLEEKTRFVEDAYLEAYLNPPDMSTVQKILKSWRPEQSTPEKIEALSQRLAVSKLENKSFFRWVRDLVISGNTKELFYARLEALVLSERLQAKVNQAGGLNSNTRYDIYKKFRKDHYNKIQLTKFVLINALTYYYFGMPLYPPVLDFISNIQLSASDLHSIRFGGIDRAVLSFKEKYKKELRIHNLVDKAPQIFFLVLAVDVGVAYFTFEVKGETAQSLERAHVTISYEAIGTENKFYKSWALEFQELNQRAPDMKRIEDRRQFEDALILLFPSFEAWFQGKHQRSPDLSRPSDLKAWQEFLSSLES